MIGQRGRILGRNDQEERSRGEKTARDGGGEAKEAVRRQVDPQEADGLEDGQGKGGLLAVSQVKIASAEGHAGSTQ